jgi:hypothetical protein
VCFPLNFSFEKEKTVLYEAAFSHSETVEKQGIEKKEERNRFLSFISVRFVLS